MTTAVRSEYDAERIRDEIRTFLTRFVDEPAVLDNAGLITGGLLDSLVAVEMIAFVENRYGLQVLDEDLEIEHFDSLENLVAFVQRKRAADG